MGVEKNSGAGERFRDLLEVAPDAMVVADAGGRILLANSQAERLLGYAARELIGQPIELLMPERFRERHVQHRGAYLDDPRPRAMGTNLALLARHKDGSEVPVEISLSPVAAQGGSVVIAAIRDVSERRRMQEAVRLGEERLRLLVESVREYAILMLDAEGRVKTWSAGAERIKGYTALEIVGRNFSVFFPPEEIEAGRPQRALAAAVRNGQHREEGWRVRRDGSRFQADVTLTPLFDSDGTLRGFAKVTRDVTERKQAEEERARAIRARDEILSLLSHDLQNAVNALSLNTELLLRVHPASASETRMHGYGQVVGRSADTMKRLIRDLIDVQHIERGRFSIDPRPEGVIPLVEEALAPMQALAEEKSVHLETRLDRGSGSALCDRGRIVQVLHNLVGNAIKFVPEGGQVVVETAPAAPQVRFAVGDNGPGILPEHLPHVFDRHWQAPSNVMRRGSGLGLFILKTIVEAHEGRTWVQSTPGAGASFFFTLPTVGVAR
jgi:PAS domain S-box-containing protein